MPDAATLAVMPYWAAGGAAIGAAAVLLARRVRSRVTGGAKPHDTLQVPGLPVAPRWNLIAAHNALVGATLGVLWGWGRSLPAAEMDRVGTACAVVGLVCGAWQVFRPRSDATPVGEPTDDTAGLTPPERLPISFGIYGLGLVGLILAT